MSRVAETKNQCADEDSGRGPCRENTKACPRGNRQPSKVGGCLNGEAGRHGRDLPEASLRRRPKGPRGPDPRTHDRGERARAPHRCSSRRARSELLALPGVGALTTANMVAETADVRRFRSKDCFARHNGTAPLPVWSGNRVRHPRSRTSNRQLNAAIHRIAVTQMRMHQPAKYYLERRIALPSNRRARASQELSANA
jgi:Transposase IS116/IS110/IS902 family